MPRRVFVFIRFVQMWRMKSLILSAAVVSLLPFIIISIFECSFTLFYATHIFSHLLQLEPKCEPRVQKNSSELKNKLKARYVIFVFTAIHAGDNLFSPLSLSHSNSTLFKSF